uniref:Putative secreted protein n=1 Tax=Rhipicephalus microplus TaxID=6941 RepID=A0A6M2DBS8_RHIMP
MFCFFFFFFYPQSQTAPFESNITDAAAFRRTWSSFLTVETMLFDVVGVVEHSVSKWTLIFLQGKSLFA